ncbi:transmembrane protein 134-like isoform X2 [Crassostrea angulata]|uniref:transmembrane protein 134 isoform X3 n=1 Tax=Magallana gigas TaxID=29159 RepID=UPI0005C3551E|nr:transmembrane protein 134 isoform X2 [Crassostrea gigas]XP_052715689.1 transmembrane protein 134-like isoform X2 [Crassostrea angulata]|eukprot:XP_011415193.1 PREDICTED: transmembrane protein 134-like isoform X2 [Crassostrea gigas]
MNKDKFNIEDAFESDEDEKIRVYGATKQTPVKGPKNREKISSTSDEIPLTECQYDGQGYSEQQLMGSSQKPGWWRHPKIKENYKTVCGAILLTVVGAALFLVGIGIVASPDRGLHCLVFFIGGVLCLIPGVYHVVYIILAINGVGGYNLYNLPVFNT